MALLVPLCVCVYVYMHVLLTKIMQINQLYVLTFIHAVGAALALTQRPGSRGLHAPNVYSPGAVSYASSHSTSSKQVSRCLIVWWHEFKCAVMSVFTPRLFARLLPQHPAPLRTAVAASSINLRLAWRREPHSICMYVDILQCSFICSAFPRHLAQLCETGRCLIAVFSAFHTHIMCTSI